MKHNSAAATWAYGLLKAAGALLAMALLLILAAVYYMLAMPGAPDANNVTVPGLPDLAGRLRGHVQVLAGDIGERHPGSMTNLNLAADYIRRTLESQGYEVSETVYGEQRFRNIRVEIPGSQRPEEILIAGAHYDTVPGSPGADDNASGVAAALELARLMQDSAPKRTIRFLFFPNEERPWGETALRGSLVSAGGSREREEAIIGMLSLEMLGYYSREAGSQRYPFFLRHFYPDQGNFLFFGANLASRPFLARAIGLFRQQDLFPAYGMAVPVNLVGDIARSDNVSYWEQGYPALMLSDTANFRNPNYHRPSDTPDTLDYEAMGRVVLALAGMLEALASD